jgi:hypothetical protein
VAMAKGKIFFYLCIWVRELCGIKIKFKDGKDGLKESYIDNRSKSIILTHQIIVILIIQLNKNL